VGGGQAQQRPSPLLLTAIGPGSAVSSPAESGTEPQPKSNLVDLTQKLFLQHFAEPRTKTANKDKDNSQLNQYLLTAFDFPTQ